MTARLVEMVFVIYYGPEAHRVTYGRKVRSGRYTKDYIQLSRKQDFLGAVEELFGVNARGTDSVPLVFKWPTGSTKGAFVLKSADRPHLKWETRLGPPQAWKMSLAPSESTAETIPGDPTHRDFDAAERELALLATRGAGQPYLVAIKLQGEPRTLHLRAYLARPKRKYAWADIRIAPPDIQALAEKTTQTRAFQWSVFQGEGTPLGAEAKGALSRLIRTTDPRSVIDALDTGTARALAHYLRQPGRGLFFDSSRNHDAWLVLPRISDEMAGSAGEYLKVLDERFPPAPDGDAAAEILDADPEEVKAFRSQIARKSFEVSDSTATVKTRGSAQKAFADLVKPNYTFRCAITGIKTRDFLVAAHIVPWSEDQSIRLDPSNGICLSLLVDRAIEKGYLLIEDDYTIRIDWDKLGDDATLRRQLKIYDGRKLKVPTKGSPKVEYLQRRRALTVLRPPSNLSRRP